MKKSARLLLWLFASMILGTTYSQNNFKTAINLPLTGQASPGNNYSLPQIMIRLSNIIYVSDETDKKKAIRDSVKNQLGMDVVWGPQELTDIFGVTYSAMFVAKDPAAENYTVVIRGTNPFSLKSWLGEDFEVSKIVPFRKFVAAAPSSAKIAKGTCNGIEDLIKLKDPDNSNTNVVEFLRSKSVKAFYVTGHSLGGTLTPPFYAYLCYKLFGGPAPINISSSPFSFAGLTAGNAAFNAFLQAYLPASNKPWRYVNPYDVAPNCWASLGSIKNIYVSNGLVYGAPESEVINYLFEKATPNGYVQPPGGEFRLPAVFNQCNTIWALQAAYQHHSTTYISLIDSCCGIKK